MGSWRLNIGKHQETPPRRPAPPFFFLESSPSEGIIEGIVLPRFEKRGYEAGEMGEGTWEVTEGKAERSYFGLISGSIIRDFFHWVTAYLYTTRQAKIFIIVNPIYTYILSFVRFPASSSLFPHTYNSTLI